uniref:Dickkopf WNT signaling pathway inhibitor 1 n=1 Tax=Seriola dumerili TaxID=41447 RepID=A0A3B4UII4_SERDU
MYKEIIPGLRGRRLSKHRVETLWKLWDSGFKATLDFVTRSFLFFSKTEGIFCPCVCSTTVFTGRIMQLPAHRFLAVYLTLFGYLGDVYAGTVLTNSNAIKNLPGASGGKGTNTVSPSPRTSPSGSVGHKLPVDTLQSGVCTDDEDCGGDEFCNDVRGACLPCRKSRKRCARDSMCCAGNRCSNGKCLPKTFIEVCFMQHVFITLFLLSPGQEGDTCLRSADCSEGLCCARHFWSRICKPVLTEGQVCTRHRRKGTHGLELFQRCDCGDGLACRPEKGERDQSVSRTAARNLHTCQRR